MKKLFLFLALLLPMAASADESGECGDGVTFFFEEATGTLTISKTGEGTGKMTDYSLDVRSPWYSYRGSILHAVVEDGVTTIGNYAFYHCNALTDIHIPNSVTSIGGGAFWECRGLVGIKIPNSVTSIGSSAFMYCTSLTSVTIPNSVTNIEYCAFIYCSGLTSVTIGNSVTKIGMQAFYNCKGLKEVHISDLSAWCKISFVDSTSNPLYFAHRLYLNGEEIKDLVIPNSVTSIGAYAFEDCSGLTSVSVEAVTPPSLKNNSFTNYDIPLFVPEESVGLYQNTSPWNKFSEIKSLSGTEPNQVAKPIITLKDGKLSFSSETEGATFIYSLSTPAAANGEGQTVALSTTYTITVYAKKEGMKNSETVTMEFDVRGLKGDVNEDGSVDAVDITKLVEIVIGKADGEPEISTDDIGTGDAGEAVRREQ